jgi:hypothetical protein
MSFTVLSWNVEFFGSRRPGESADDVRARLDRVFEYLREPDIEADVYAIFEVNGGQVFEKVKAEFPEYSWQITEGPGAQEILVGFRIPAFVTQKLDFSKGFNGPLRPGTLVTVTHQGQDYPMLFLHLKAADRAIDFGVRVHQHGKARNLRKALDGLAPTGQANFIIAGDLNSVGLNLTFSSADIELDEEIDRLKAMYGSQFDNMPVRSKTHAATFWNGPGSSDDPSDLDHVVAADRVNLAPIAGAAAAEIAVKGWPEEADDIKKGEWIRDFSDHAALRFTVTGAN